MADDADEEEEEQPPQQQPPQQLAFPLARVRKIIKYDDDITQVREEAVAIACCAAERFLGYLVEETAREAARSRPQPRSRASSGDAGGDGDDDHASVDVSLKRLTYDDFSKTVNEIDALHFLSDIVPQRKRARDIQSMFVQQRQRQRQLQQQQGGASEDAESPPPCSQP